MANIKGITVEIGGDTTGLNKALESVNKTIKSTASELKDTFPAPVTVVAFYFKHIQHGGEGCICPDQRGRTFFQKTGKDIAMMKIYRYHGYDVLRRNERGRTVSSN